MITPKNITKKQAARLLTLIERETRCEIMARLGRFDNLEFMDYALKQRKYQDRIRELIFGTSNILQLAQDWGMIRRKQKRRG